MSTNTKLNTKSAPLTITKDKITLKKFKLKEKKILILFPISAHKKFKYSTLVPVNQIQYNSQKMINALRKSVKQIK
jgi:hypothetical protein